MIAPNWRVVRYTPKKDRRLPKSERTVFLIGPLVRKGRKR